MKRAADSGSRGAIVIRPMRRSDGSSFLSLVNALADYERLPRPSAAARRRLLRDCRTRFETLIAIERSPARGPRPRAAGRAIGYAVFFETYSTFLARPTLYLEDLFVLPASRGRGTGMALFRACVAEAKRRGCGRMDWTVLDWNRSAMKFYRSLGAAPMKEWILFRLNRESFDRALRPRRAALPPRL